MTVMMSFSAMLLLISWQMVISLNYNVKCHRWKWVLRKQNRKGYHWISDQNLGPEPCTKMVNGSLPTSCSHPYDLLIHQGFEGDGCGHCQNYANCRDTLGEKNGKLDIFRICQRGIARKRSKFRHEICRFADSQCVRPFILNGEPLDNTADVFGCSLLKYMSGCNDKVCKTCSESHCNHWPPHDDIKCKIGIARNESQFSNLTSQYCPYGPVQTKCMRPLIVNNAPVRTDFITFGCVTQNTTCSTTSECKVCSTEADCNSWPDTDDIKCKTGTANNISEYSYLPSHFCPYGSAACIRPIIKNGAPVKGDVNTFGCKTERLTCKDNTSCKICHQSDCNAWPAAGSDYQVECFIWSWDGRNWISSTNPMPCSTKVNGILPTSCSLPLDPSDRTGFSGNGCGVCTDHKKCLGTVEKWNKAQWQYVCLGSTC